MSRRQTVVLVSTLPVLLFVGLVVVPPSPAATSDDDPASLAVLQRAVQASATVAFSGLQVVTFAGSNGTAATRWLDVRADGSGQRWMRVHPRSGSRTPAGGWASGRIEPAADPLTLLAGAFALAPGLPGRVAGRVADVVIARRDGTVASRLWVDRRTGLLLRQEVLDTDGTITRMASFVELTIAGPARPGGAASPPAPAASPGPARASGSAPAAGRVPGPRIDPDSMVALQQESARCPQVLPGGLVLIDARPATAADAVHLTYTDGLAGVSVFVQQGRLGAMPATTTRNWSGAQVHLAAGSPARLSWQGGDDVYTLVGDLPRDLQRAVVAALPHDGGQASLVDRLGHGLRTALDDLSGRG